MPVSYEECVRHSLHHSSRRFAENDLYVLSATSYLCNRAAYLSAHRRATFRSLEESSAIANLELSDLHNVLRDNALVRRIRQYSAAASNDTGLSAETLQGAGSLLRNVELACSAFKGSKQQALAARAKGQAACLRLGYGGVFVTLSCNFENELTVMVSSGLIDETTADFAVDGVLPTPQERFVSSIRRPVFSAMYFDALVDAFIEDLVGWNVKEAKPRKEVGIFGRPMAVNLGIESTGSGRLHAHIIVHVLGLPSSSSDVFELFESSERQGGLGAFYNSIISTSFMSFLDKFDLSRLQAQGASDNDEATTVHNDDLPPRGVEGMLMCDVCMIGELVPVHIPASARVIDTEHRRASPVVLTCEHCGFNVTEEAWRRRIIDETAVLVGADVPTSSFVTSDFLFRPHLPYPFAPVSDDADDAQRDEHRDALMRYATTTGTMQFHSVNHTTTCSKGDAPLCRMHYPRLPQLTFRAWRRHADEPCSCVHCASVHTDYEVCRCAEDFEVFGVEPLPFTTCERQPSSIRRLPLYYEDADVINSNEDGFGTMDSMMMEIERMRFGPYDDGGTYIDCITPRMIGSEYFVQHSPAVVTITHANNDVRPLGGPLDTIYALKYSIKPQPELETLGDICVTAAARIDHLERGRVDLHGSHEAASQRINTFLRGMSKRQMSTMQAALILLKPKTAIPFYRSSHTTVDLKLSQALHIIETNTWTTGVANFSQDFYDDGESDETRVIQTMAGVEHYKLRSPALRALSWYSFVEGWEVVKFAWHGSDCISSDDTNEALIECLATNFALDCDMSNHDLQRQLDLIWQMPYDLMLRFVEGHPRYDTHGLVRRSQWRSTRFYAPVFVNIVGPRLPDQLALSASWQKRERYGEMCLLLFCPFEDIKDLLLVSQMVVDPDTNETLRVVEPAEDDQREPAFWRAYEHRRAELLDDPLVCHLVDVQQSYYDVFVTRRCFTCIQALKTMTTTMTMTLPLVTVGWTP